MNGVEQLVAWLFRILMAAVTVSTAVRTLSEARVACAKAQFGVPLHVPADWPKDGER